VGSLFLRGSTWWASLKGPDGWIQKSTGCKRDQKAAATRYLKRAQELLDARRTAGEPAGPLTVEAWAEEWLASRRQKHEVTLERYRRTGAGTIEHRDHRGDEGRVRRHILPHLGRMHVKDVRPQHMASWVHALRTSTSLASHTLRSVYGLAMAMFRDAAVAGHTAATPCILTKAQLGDDAPTAGAGRYSRSDLELMIGSDQLPEHARVFAALGGLCGLRLGAVAGLRWGDLDTTTGPLWTLTSSRTYVDLPQKTGVASVIPVHPVLRGMLESWRHGWGRQFGRPPTANDPIVPRTGGRTPGAPHTRGSGGTLMSTILSTLGITPAAMPVHALRSTFVSMALEDGCDRDLVKRITHPAVRGRDAFARYDRGDYWPRLCEAILRVRICPKSGGSVEPLFTPLLTVEETSSDSDEVDGNVPGYSLNFRSAIVHLSTPTARDQDPSTDADRSSRTPTVKNLVTPPAQGPITDALDRVARAIGRGDLDAARDAAGQLCDLLAAMSAAG
jgi:integrase